MSEVGARVSMGSGRYPETTGRDLAPEEFFTLVSRGRRFSVCVADDREKREKAFRLMYDIYEGIGYGRPHPSRMWFSVYELLPESVTVVILEDEEPVATITTVYDSPLGLPDDATYKEEIDLLRRRGKRLSQVISLGVRDDVRGDIRLVARLFDAGYLVARGVRGATDFIQTAVPRHVPFYEKKMLFKRIGGVRFQEKTGVDVVLLHLDFNDCEAARRRYRGEDKKGAAGDGSFYRYTPIAEEVPRILYVFRSKIEPISPEDVRYFIGMRPEVLEKASPAQRRFLEDYMGGVT